MDLTLDRRYYLPGSPRSLPRGCARPLDEGRAQRSYSRRTS
ncbi:hypothetical protein [Streptomyces nigrescens]